MFNDDKYSFPRRLLGLWFVLAVAAALTGCGQTSSGEISNYAERRWTWGSFISGEDIAKACTADSQGRYRFTRFANQAEQVRIYDLDVAARTLRVRIMEQGIKSKNIKLGSGFFEQFAPYDQTVSLASGAAQEIEQALISDNFGNRPAQDGQMLLSRWHFWLVRGCRAGETRLRVWIHPDEDYKALTFPKALYALDPSGIDVNEPKNDDRFGPLYRDVANEGTFSHYQMWAYPEQVVISNDLFDPGRN